MIDFRFSAEQELKREEIIAFSNSYFNQQVEQRDENQEFDRSLWIRAGEILLPGLSVPQEFGGAGLDEISTISALEALGYGCRDNGLSFAIGSQKQKEDLLPSLCNGTLIAANAMTEEHHGSDVFLMETSVVKQKGKLVLNGSKVYVSNAPEADLLLTYALTDKNKGSMGGISCLLLNKSEFVSSEKVHKMGLRSCPMGMVSFDHVNIGAESFVGKQGAGAVIFNMSMAWERIGLSALHLGTLQRLLDQAVIHVKNPDIKNGRLKNFQAITHQLAAIKSSITGARWATYYAAWCLANKEKAALYTSISKLQASEIYKNSCTQLLQIYGAMGYINQHEIERSVRDAMASTLYSGSSEIQKNIIFGLLNDKGL